jgi:glycosyltransferase involved in cell wall biosynthesis
VTRVKKILFLTDNFPPEVNAPASRTYEHTKEWVKKGYEVTVITCAPNFPKGELFSGYKNRISHSSNVDGIKVIRVWSFIRPNKGFVLRVFDFASFALSSFLRGLFIKTDIIIATSPQFFTATSGWALSLFKRKPWVMEVRDIWPEAIATLGQLREGSYLYKFLEKVELALYASAEKIIVVTDSFRENLISRKVEPRKVFVHKNGVVLDNFNPSYRDESIFNEFPQLRDKKIIAYIGTHGLAHGLTFILRSIPSLIEVNSKLHFLFIGEGAEKVKLIEMAETLKIKNVTFLPFVKKNEIVRYLSVIDISLVNLIKSDTYKAVIPSKIFEAAAMQKPILLGLEGEAKEIIEKYNAGLCFEPENQIDFIQKCQRILKDENYNIFQDGCNILAKDFNRKTIALQMLHEVCD